MSYGRMEEKQEQLRDEVKQWLEQAEAADEEEDRRHGSQRGDELPEELRRRETRLAQWGKGQGDPMNFHLGVWRSTFSSGLYRPDQAHTPKN